jgi:uncharacterized membrane protein (DUF2068 family)
VQVDPALRPGERLIVAYKLIKGGVQILLAITTALVPLQVMSGDLARVTLLAHQHASARWAYLLEGLMSQVTPARLRLAAAALAGDGLLSLLEGWGLARRWRWAPWFVVVATGAFIPVELLLLLKQATLGRMILLVVNTAIVAYLVHGRRRNRAGR